LITGTAFYSKEGVLVALDLVVLVQKIEWSINLIMSLKKLGLQEDRLPTSGLYSMLKQSTVNYTLIELLKILRLAVSST
jgi:hypothetical protein